MNTLDFSRSVDVKLKTEEDRLLNAILDFTRSDSASIDFTSKTVKMDIYDKHGGTLIDTLMSGTEITISTARLTITKIFTDLSVRGYYYKLYNDTDKIGIARGTLIVI